MDSYKRLERRFLFEPHMSAKHQHLKLREEMDEVEYEVVLNEDSDSMSFTDKDGLKKYINEILDLKLSANNLLLKIEREFGEECTIEAMKEWDLKIKSYSEKKYKIMGE
ncbi:MAG: hypothetical protein ACRC5T_03930 [Cetobacterium sp.]